MTITFSAVILAGGQARRMGGVDKGLQLFRNQPLFEHIYQRLQPQIADIAINANRNQQRYAQSGLPVFSDDLAGFQGPLSGILTALQRAQSNFVLFVPCDCPFSPWICLPNSNTLSFRNTRNLPTPMTANENIPLFVWFPPHSHRL